jgi:hypothetical protein
MSTDVRAVLENEVGREGVFEFFIFTVSRNKNASSSNVRDIDEHGW